MTFFVDTWRTSGSSSSPVGTTVSTTCHESPSHFQCSIASLLSRRGIAVFHGCAFRTSNADAGAAVAAPAASSTDAAKMERTSLSPSSSPPWPPPPPPPQSFAPISRLGSCGGNAGGERRSALLSGVEEHDAAASAATAAPSPSALSDGVRLRERSGNAGWTPLALGWCEPALLSVNLSYSSPRKQF